MFNLEQAIVNWRRQMARKGIKTPAVLDELEGHLRDEIERQVGLGADEQAAFDTAVACFGDSGTLAAEFRKLGNSRLRFLKACYFTFAAGMFGVNAWTLLAYDLSALERICGFVAVSLLCLYLAGVLSWIGSIPVRARHWVAAAIKLLSWPLALWPACALLEALHLFHFGGGIVVQVVLWCMYAAGVMTVIAFGFYARSGWFGGSSGPLFPPSGPTFQPIPPEGPIPPEMSFSIPGSRPVDSEVRQSLQAACREANRLGLDFVGTEHVLLGLIQVASGHFANVLRELNINRELVRAEVERLVYPTAPHADTRALALTPRAGRAVRLAGREAKALNRPSITPEHIFLGLLLEGTGVGALVLRKLGIDAATIRRQILSQVCSDRG